MMKGKTYNRAGKIKHSDPKQNKVTFSSKTRGSYANVIFPALFLLATPLVYTESVLDPVLVPRTLFLSLLMIPFLIYLLIFVNRGNADVSVVKNPLFWLYLAYVMLTGISVILSVNPGEGIYKFLRVLLFFMIFSSFTLLFADMQKMLRPLLVIFMVFSALALSRGVFQLLNVLSAGLLNHETSYFINSWFAHRNLFAQILLFTLPFLLMVFFSLGRALKVIAGILITISLVMITLLLVKSVWLALMVSTVLSLALVIIFRKQFGISTPQFRRIGIYLFSGMLIVMISVAVYSRFQSIETFEKQTYVLKNYRFGSAIERVHLWEKSFEMFKESPLIGIGTANWNIYLPDYGTEGMRSGEGQIIYQRPHNDFLWVLAENGIVAFIFYGLLYLMAIIYQVQIIRKSQSIQLKLFALALFFFMISYGIAAMLSFPSERPVHSLILSLVFATTVAVHHQSIHTAKNASEGNTRWMLLSFLILTLCISYVGFRKLQSEYHVRNALQDRMDGKWQSVIDEIEQGDDFFTRLDPTATPLRWYSGLARFNLGLKDEALQDFESAYRANPYHMHVLNNLATIKAEKGDYATAINFLREAVRIAPTFSDAVINLSSSLYNVGETDSAYAVLRNAQDIAGHHNYEKVVWALVYRKVESLKKQVDDRDLSVTLTRIRNSNEWMVKVHEQSISDHVPLDNHLIIESIYMLEKVDQTIDSSRANYLREKYLSNH